MISQTSGGIGETLADIGEEAWRLFVQPIYHHGWSMAFPIFALITLAIFAMMAWRSWTKTGRRLALTKPRRYVLLHGPFWTPALLMLGALAVVGLPPLVMLYIRSFPFDLGIRAMGAAVLIFPVGVAILLKRFFREKALRGQHGSGFWAARSDLAIASNDPKKGWPWVLPIKVSWRGTAKEWSTGALAAGRTVVALLKEVSNRMILLVGATGSGKGFTVFAAIIASIRQPFILQDVKSECQGMDTLRALTGLEPIRWGCAAQGGWPSMRWNPLHEARSAAEPENECAALASTLTPTMGNQNDFIQTLSADTLAFIFRYSSEQTLSEIGAAIEFEGLLPYMERLKVTPGLLGRLQGKNMENWVADAIKGALSPFSSGWGKEVTDGHDFDLEEMFTRGGYVLSAEPIYARALPIRVFWGMLIRRMLQSNNARNLTLLYDEGLAAGKIPDFQNALVTLRSKGISIIFGVQHSQGVLALYGPTEGQAILDSFVNSIYLLNGLNPDDQRKLSQQLGKRTLVEKGQAGTGAARRRVQVGADLLELADIERRARSGRFWAVIRAQELTKGGAPVMAELTGSAGAGLVRHPEPHEIQAALAAMAATPPPPVYVPPPVPTREKPEAAGPVCLLASDCPADEEPVFAASTSDDYPPPPDFD